MGIHRPLRNAKIPVAVCLALSGTALAAGCSAAPAGADHDSPPIGPVRTGTAALNFPPFPMPAKWAGPGGARYTMIVKPKTSAVPRKFSFTPKASLELWLGCIGTGIARLVSPAMSLNWEVPCGSSPDPTGLTFTPPASALDRSVKVLVTSPAQTRWVFRVDQKSVPAKTA